MKVVAAVVLVCSAFACNAQIFASGRSSEVPLTVESLLLLKPAQPVPYKVSYPPGYRMRNTGRTLTIIGGAMLIGGIIVYNQADLAYDYYTQTDYKEQQKAALGVLMIMGGTGMTVPGIIFWSKGSKKYKRHLEREAAFNFQGTGISVSYRF
jgi:hypothetical protein